ncbi:MAG: hypothetical protein JSU96_06505 [Acidobacteriota bacterium]|nr:MAG: hypothetical protein JSU96_06505 [Acidobacteriota bacterium]
MLESARLFFRYAAGLHAFLKRKIDLDQATQIVSRSQVSRGDAFLQLLNRSVFDHSGSPYLPLFRQAGIGFEDVQRLVKHEGLDGALKTLLREGVSISLDEFKGRTRTVRPGLPKPACSSDFDNPFLVKHFEAETGGSKGVSQRLSLDLDLLVFDAACHYLFLKAFGISDSPLGVWRTVPPAVSAIRKPLLQAKIGRTTARWFSQNWFQLPSGLKYWFFTYFTILMARLSGERFPSPEHLPLDHASKVAQWLAQEKRAGRNACLDTMVSSAIRVCRAAQDQGLDISHCFMRVGSEALTPARAVVLSDAGVRFGAHYAITEVGPVAMACSDRQCVDEAHLLTGKLALIQDEKTTDRGERIQDAFYLTGLLPSLPKIMINVEMGDRGVIATRNCDCPLSQAGFRQTVHTIRSYEKLTSEGMLFTSTDLAAVVEDLLPQRFGGDPSDYQFVESSRDGLTEVHLILSPRLGKLNDLEVIDAVMSFLGDQSDGYRLMTKFWADGGTLKVVREEPKATRASKILPLYVPPPENGGAR